MKKLQNIVAIVLAMVLMSVSFLALAEEAAQVNPPKQETVEKASEEKAEEKTEKAEEKAEAKTESKKSIKVTVKGTAQIGKTIKLKATIKGYENYKIIWQTSEDDGKSWETVKGSKKTLKVKVTKANKNNLWRVALDVAE